MDRFLPAHEVQTSHRYAVAEEKFLADCVSCGICIQTCPCIPVSSLSTVEGPEVCDGIKEDLQKGRLSALTAQRAFACSRCGACIGVCPQDIDVYDLQQALRARVQREEGGTRIPDTLRIGNFRYTPADIDLVLASLQSKPSDRRWIEKIPKAVSPRENVLFLGCATRRYVDKVNIVVDILRDLGLDMVVIGGGELCCGTRAQSSGRQEDADRQGVGLVSALGQYKPEQVLVMCPSCYFMLKKEIPRLCRVPFEVKHVLQLLAENVKRLPFNREVNRKVGYHDPCKLGRMCGEYKSPREILAAIPGLQLIETGQETACCGGTAWLYSPAIAKKLRKILMDGVSQMGVEVLATACFLCYRKFIEAASAYSYEVMDIFELLAFSIGIEQENKLRKFWSYHDPVRVVAEAEEEIKASPYSRSQILELLPHIL